MVPSISLAHDAMRICRNSLYTDSWNTSLKRFGSMNKRVDGVLMDDMHSSVCNITLAKLAIAVYQHISSSSVQKESIPLLNQFFQ